MRTRISISTLATFVVCLVAGVLAQSASAATFTVHGCRLPDGSEIGLQASVGSGPGWNYQGVANPTFSDPTPCGTDSESIIVQGFGLNEASQWTFHAPPTSDIVGYRVTRQIAKGANATRWGLFVNDSAGYPNFGAQEDCSSSAACGSLPSVATGSGFSGNHYLHLLEECQSGFCDSVNRTVISAAEIDLRDDYLPAGAVNGLTNVVAARGNAADQNITVNGNDVGAGLLRAELLVNGTVVQTRAFTSAASCADQVAGNARYDYTVFQPCPTTGGTQFTYNPGNLPVGTHTASLRLTDAAGNVVQLPTTATWTIRAPQCSDGGDNDGDGKIDATDPGCHSGPGNTYNPNDDSEDSDGPAPKPQCSDGADNDADGRIDIADPACHTDGNPNNPSSYNPADDSEAGDPQCSDGRDNDGDRKVDINDPACHSDFDVTNPSSYVPGDDSEAGDPQCADGRDNDRDRTIDAKDAGCKSGPSGRYNPSDDDESTVGPACKGTITALNWQSEKRKSMRSKLRIAGKTAYAKRGVRVVFRGKVTGCAAGTELRVNHLIGSKKVQKTGLKVRAGGKFTGFAEMSAGSRNVRVYGKNNRTLRLTRTSQVR